MNISAELLRRAYGEGLGESYRQGESRLGLATDGGACAREPFLLMEPLMLRGDTFELNDNTVIRVPTFGSL